jgi:hypothetical protein
VDRLRASGCHYFPPWVTGLWLSLGILALILSGGCRRGVPAVDLTPKTALPRGTISGVVRAPEAMSAVAGRTVEIIDAQSGERRTVRTGANGQFAIELPAGNYRLELPLKDGERLLRRPDVVDLARADLDSHVEFVLSARLARPRGPAYRLDNGLGSPIT